MKKLLSCTIASLMVLGAGIVGAISSASAAPKSNSKIVYKHNDGRIKHFQDLKSDYFGYSYNINTNAVTLSIKGIPGDGELHIHNFPIFKGGPGNLIITRANGVNLNGLEKLTIECENLNVIIADKTFEYCANLQSVNFIGNAKGGSIRKGAFMGCRSLTTINIPDSVTQIGERAFMDCSSLTNIEIPSSVTKIEEGTFSGCVALTTITIPSSITEIGGAAFYDCNSLKEITLPSSIQRIGYDVTFNISYPSSSSSITYPAYKAYTASNYYEFDSIKREAFQGCNSLTTINIPSFVYVTDWYYEYLF